MMRFVALVTTVLFAVALPAHATVEVRELPVPRAAIYPGDVIGAEMLVGKAYRVDTRNQLTVHDRVEELVGKVARRTLLPGQLIPLNAVRQEDLVKHGRPVTLLFEAEGLSISATGIALQSGAPGDFISVRNAETGVTIKGVIGSDGIIRVGGS
jgi:flagella basal body P-ring formation protein FlgA